MKIVCIGDSLTYGFGVLKNQRWVEMCGNLFENVEFVNRGINGDTTSGMLSRSYEDIILNYPDVAIIMGGTNDFLSFYDSKMVEQNIIELVKECDVHEIKPIIAIQMPVVGSLAKKNWADKLDYFKINKNIEKYRQNIIKYCDDKLYKYIDFYGDLLESVAVDELEKYYLDGIHPNYEGHKLMVESVKKVIKPLI
ncbi:GDSL-type esterase/lipase family protein [Haloimpatiens sp. FM7315]|uniref:GDSL-type esterase/lipase family protein n=1 Tax=Haloimpatiens sp. FM7315 TaxID=3298609 RepID=UPI0035A37A4D